MSLKNDPAAPVNTQLPGIIKPHTAMPQVKVTVGSPPENKPAPPAPAPAPK